VSQVAYGTIVGIVTNSTKLPVAGATVTAVRVDGSSIRATVSGSDGVYSFPDLAPGAWSITAQREGAADVVVASVQVVTGKASRNDLVMATGPAGATPSPAATPAAPAVAAIPEALQAPEPSPEVDTPTVCQRWRYRLDERHPA
jgi:hypothetical protein